MPKFGKYNKIWECVKTNILHEKNLEIQLKIENMWKQIWYSC